jgi:hypothetical protein
VRRLHVEQRKAAHYNARVDGVDYDKGLHGRTLESSLWEVGTGHARRMRWLFQNQRGRRKTRFDLISTHMIVFAHVLRRLEYGRIRGRRELGNALIAAARSKQCVEMRIVEWHQAHGEGDI